MTTATTGNTLETHTNTHTHTHGATLTRSTDKQSNQIFICGQEAAVNSQELDRGRKRARSRERSVGIERHVGIVRAMKTAANKCGTHWHKTN